MTKELHENVGSCGQAEGLCGSFAISKCGHDKGQCFVIVGYSPSVVSNKTAAKSKRRAEKPAAVVLSEPDGHTFVYVADGVVRTLTAPKRKNIKHLFVSKKRVDGFTELLAAEAVSGNLRLRQKIKEFQSQTKICGGNE